MKLGGKPLAGQAKATKPAQKMTGNRGYEIIVGACVSCPLIIPRLVEAGGGHASAILKWTLSVAGRARAHAFPECHPMARGRSHLLSTPCQWLDSVGFLLQPLPAPHLEGQPSLGDYVVHDHDDSFRGKQKEEAKPGRCGTLLRTDPEPN